MLRNAAAGAPRLFVVQGLEGRDTPVHQILAPATELDRGSVKRLFKDYYKIMKLPPRRVKSMCQLSGCIRLVALAATYVSLLFWAALAPAGASGARA